MPGEHVLRRGLRAAFAERGKAVGNLGFGSVRQMKCVVEWQKQAEYFRPADHGDGAIARAELFQRPLEAGAERIPKKRIGMIRIRSESSDPARQHEPLAPRGARSAFVRMPAVYDDRGAVERVLEEALIGLVAKRIRHRALGVGKHAVGGNDDIAFDAAHSAILREGEVAQQPNYCYVAEAMEAAMSCSPSLIMAQFLAWVAERPRTREQAVEAWHSCPHSSVWEDAVVGGLVRTENDGHRTIALTGVGRAVLEKARALA